MRNQQKVSGRSFLIPMALLLVTVGASAWYSGHIAAAQPTSVHLRSEPLTVAKDEMQQVFGLNDDHKPLTYLQHDYKDQGLVVLDHVTGLMWQKAGLDYLLTYAEAQAYIRQLNAQQFAGHNDWRLPTIPELMSLLEPEKQSNGLYLNPIFDSQQWCWSADKSSSGSAWRVYFDSGGVSWIGLSTEYYVRAVRSNANPHSAD
jgi:hypothetical protein